MTLERTKSRKRAAPTSGGDWPVPDRRTFVRLVLVLVGFPLLLVFGVGSLEPARLTYAGIRSGWAGFWLAGVVLEWITLLLVLGTMPSPARAKRTLGFGDGLSKARLMMLVMLVSGSALLAALGAGGDQAFLSRVPEGARMFFPPPDVASRLFWVLVAVTAATCEELLWRGVAYHDLRSLGLSSLSAVALSSLSFAFFHGGLAQGMILMGYRFGIGALLAGIYLRSGSLWPAMVVHYLMDASALAAI